MDPNDLLAFWTTHVSLTRKREQLACRRPTPDLQSSVEPGQLAGWVHSSATENQLCLVKGNPATGAYVQFNVDRGFTNRSSQFGKVVFSKVRLGSPYGTPPH